MRVCCFTSGENLFPVQRRTAEQADILRFVGETVGSWFAVIHSGSIIRRRMDQFPMIPSSTWRLKPILKKRGQSDAVREEI